MADVLTGKYFKMCEVNHMPSVLRERIYSDCRNENISTHLNSYFRLLHGEEELTCHQSSGFHARKVRNGKEVDFSMTGAAWLERLTRTILVGAQSGKSVTEPW